MADKGSGDCTHDLVTQYGDARMIYVKAPHNLTRSFGLLSVVLCMVVVLYVSITVAWAASPFFAATYGREGVDTAHAVQQTNDGGYIVGGRTGFLGANDYDDNVWVLKLNSLGGIEWQKVYGGTNTDYTYTIQQTSDGGYIVGGWTKSFGTGEIDIWLLKLANNGNVTWQKTYGGVADEVIWSIQQTNDDGYIVGAETVSFGAGQNDIWILKLNSLGNLEWQKTYGGIWTDFARSIEQTSDGGYIVAGGTRSFPSGQVRTDSDAWILKLDSSGNVEWEKTYGGVYYDYARSIRQTSDENYMVLGAGGETGNVWLIKLDGNGNIIWQKTYGGTRLGSSFQQTNDGGYIVTGRTATYRIWLLKVNSVGEITWQKAYRGIRSAVAESIQQTNDGGYIVAGSTESLWYEAGDLFVLRLDQNGDGCPCCPGYTVAGETLSSTATVKVSNAITGSTTVTTTNTTISPIDSPFSPHHFCYCTYLPTIFRDVNFGQKRSASHCWAATCP